VQCLGTSGTLENIAALCGGDHEIELSRLTKLEERLLKTTTEDRARIRGLDDQRKDQIIAGVTLVGTFMRMLKLKRIELCGAALREGILADYLSRHVPDLQIRRDVPDPRRRSVLDLARRCNWYESHSLQVAKLTLKLFDDLKPLHGLGDRERELIEYGALLHDIGWHIAPRGHHKHSQYLILNGHLKNFDPDEVKVIAKITRFHRKSMPNTKKHKLYASLGQHDRKIVRVGAALLRIADALDRSHANSVQDVKASIGRKTVTLTLTSTADIQLELWAARKKREMFEKVLDHALGLETARPR
jgi:exopolyphosphatase / guanosine-5'-triphosphate,3'-diphosphate pyrophosphatase